MPTTQNATIFTKINDATKLAELPSRPIDGNPEHQAPPPRIATNVPLGVMPDSILPLGRALAQEDGPGARAYQAGRNALKQLYEASAAFEEVNSTHKGQPIMKGVEVVGFAQSDEQKQTIAAAMGARYATLAKGFETHIGVVADTIATLDSAMEKSLQMKLEPIAAQAVRAYIAALEPGARPGFLMDAISKGDKEVLASAFSASSFLSGLPRERMAMLKDEAKAKFAPKEYGLHQAATKLHGHLTDAAATVTKRYAQLLPKIAPNAATAAMKRLREGV